MDNQHLAVWRIFISTHKQARKLISGRSPTANARLLAFNRTQSRVVTGLLTGRNYPKRRTYLMGLMDNPNCRRCEAQEETSANVFCECESLVSLRHPYLGSFFLDPEHVKVWVQSGTLVNQQGLCDLDIRLRGTKGLSKGLRASGPKVLEPICYSFLFHSILRG